MIISDLIGDYTSFLDQIFSNLRQVGLDVSAYELDHVCYRVSSLENYLSMKSALSGFGTLLTEADVNGRPIATFKLHQPLQYQNRQIYLLELPAPKKGKDMVDGLEHVEFVAGSDIPVIMKNHPRLSWNTSGLSKMHNPELELKFADGLAIKFHPESLEEVIRQEVLAGKSV